MRTYTVHRPRRAAGDPDLEADQTIFVKEGFSWLALLIPLLWFIYHRMWLVLVGYFLLTVLIGVLSDVLGLGSALGGAVYLIVQAVVAAEANDLRRWTLSRRGYEFVQVVSGPSLFEAETAYFKTWVAEMNAARASRAGNETAIAFRADLSSPT